MLKSTLRLQMKKIRNSIPEGVRKSAAYSLLNQFSKSTGLTLSYASFGSELDTSLLNRALAVKRALVLPRVCDNQLRLFKVQSLENDLCLSPLGFMEPLPEKCLEVLPSDLQTLLVPGLAFVQSGHRLGYGKGHFDRLLSRLPPSVNTIGVGFKKQLVTCLPVESHDIALKYVYLF